MRWLVLANVAAALAGAHHRLRLRGPFAPRHGVRLRRPALAQTSVRHAAKAATAPPELAELNALVAERRDAADAKARECVVMREAFLQSTAVSEARASAGGDLTLLGANRDLASATVGLARVEEDSLDEDTHEDCEARRAAGEKALHALERQLDKAKKERVQGDNADLYDAVLGRLEDKLTQQRDVNGRIQQSCEELVEERNLELERHRAKEERLYAQVAKTSKHLGAAEEPLLPVATNVQTCLADLKDLQAQATDAHQQRDAVLVAHAADAVTDCEVSDWIENSCSATCGGGTRVLSRRVVRPQDGGARCPALSAVEPCNHEPCPQDCELGDWSAWSSCVEVKTRVRHVTQQPNVQGAPCGGLTETLVCGAGLPECVLGEWGEWSGCSRACGGGSMRQTRGASDACGAVKVERLGVCNAFACDEDLECKQAERVAFILDGSGSNGLTRWAMYKKLAQELVSKLPEGHSSVLLAGQDVTHVADWATAASDAAAAVGAAGFPASTTTLPAALEHGLGTGARTFVLFTDGQVNSPLEMAAASRRAAEAGGRIVVVAPELAAASAGQFASQPVHDNVLGISMQDEAVAASTNTLVSMLCSELGA